MYKNNNSSHHKYWLSNYIWKGFVLLNDVEVTAIQGGALAKQCSCCGDVDSDSGDSYKNDKAVADAPNNG